MKFIRVISLLLITIFSAVVITGCTGQKNYTIAFCNGYIGNNWRTQMIEDLQTAFEDYRKAGLVSNLIIQNAGTDVNNQIAQIRNMINSKVDLLIIDPNSETMLNPIIEEAHEKGIPVIAVDQPVSSPYAVNIVTDQQKWGENLAKWLVKEINGKGNIVIIEGVTESPANENRMIGVRRVFAKNPDIKVLASQNADWDQANAQRIMADLIYKYPKIDGVLTQDGMSLGVLKAYINTNREIPKVTGETMVGFLRLWKELEPKTGFYSFGQNNPPGISRTALGIAVRMLQGKKLKQLQNNTFYYPVKDLVTYENLDKYFESNKDKPETYFLDEWLSEAELDELFED